MTNISLGVGPAKVQVPVTWARIKSFFTRRNPTDRLEVLLKNSSLAITRPDEGEIAIYLWIVNFGSKLRADRLTVDNWSWLSYQMPALPWVARGLPTILAKQSLTTLYISCQLNSAAIRRIREASPGEPWRLLGGGLALQVSGYLHIAGLSASKHFSFDDQRPSISAHWLVSPES